MQNKIIIGTQANTYDNVAKINYEITVTNQN